MKRNMVRFVSHEIRTPLNTVNIGLELLERELKRVKGKKNVIMLDTISSMHEQTRAAIDILSDLLNYEKLDSGLMKLDSESIQAWRLLTESVKPFRAQVQFFYSYQSILTTYSVLTQQFLLLYGRRR